MRIRVIRGRLFEPMHWKGVIAGALIGVMLFVALGKLPIATWQQAVIFGVTIASLGGLYQLRYDRYWDRRLGDDPRDSWT